MYFHLYFLSLVSEDAFNFVMWFLPVCISVGFCSGSLYSGALYTLHVWAQLFFTMVAISVMVCDRTHCTASSALVILKVYGQDTTDEFCSDEFISKWPSVLFPLGFVQRKRSEP